jgi:hypothetical protein
VLLKKLDKKSFHTDGFAIKNKFRRKGYPDRSPHSLKFVRKMELTEQGNIFVSTIKNLETRIYSKGYQ